MKWNNIKDGVPKEGELCVIYFPFAVNNLTGKTTGQMAMAYFRDDEGWIYADKPTPVRFDPYYWIPWEAFVGGGS